MGSSSSTPARDCEGSVSGTEHDEASAAAAGLVIVISSGAVPLAASQKPKDFTGV